MKINRTVIIIILGGIYIGLMLSGAFHKLEYLEGDVSDTGDDHKKIDAWIERNNLDIAGNPIGTMYTGGTPLFDQNTGTTIDKYDYIINNHRDKPWNTEDDAVGIKPRPVTDFAPSPRNDVEEVGLVWTSIDPGENWIEEEERLGSLPLRPESTLPAKPGQNVTLGNPPRDLPSGGLAQPSDLGQNMIRNQLEGGQDRLFSDFSEDEQADILAQVTESLVGGNSVDEALALGSIEIKSTGDVLSPGMWNGPPLSTSTSASRDDIVPVRSDGAEEKRVIGNMLPFTDGFPEHWGERPRVETADIKAFPPEFVGIGGRSGSSTMYSWISENLQMDKDNGIDYISLIRPDPEYELDGRFYTTPMPSPPDREFDELKLAAAVISTDPTRRVPGYVGEPVIKPTMDVGPSPETTPMPTPEEEVVRYEGAEEEREEASDTKNMNIGIGISVGVLALFLILFTYYKLRRRY